MSAIVLRRHARYLKTIRYWDARRTVLRHSRPETPVTCDTPRCDALPTARESIRRTLASEQSLGGLLHERPAIRTWVRDVRRFWGRSPSSAPSSDLRARIVRLRDHHHRPQCLESLPIVQRFCTKSSALRKFPPGPHADAARFLGPYQRTVDQD